MVNCVQSADNGTADRDINLGNIVGPSAPGNMYWLPPSPFVGTGWGKSSRHVDSWVKGKSYMSMAWTHTGGVEVQLYLFLTSLLDGAELSALLSGHFAPGTHWMFVVGLKLQSVSRRHWTCAEGDNVNQTSLDNDQLDAHLLYFTIRPLQSSTCFEHYMLIIRRLIALVQHLVSSCQSVAVQCTDWDSSLSTCAPDGHWLRGRYQMLHQCN